MTAGSGLFSTARGVNPAKTVAGKGGLPGEVGDLRRDVSKELAPMFAETVREFINPILGTAASLLAATATVAATVTVPRSALTAATLTNMADNPRQLIFTSGGATAANVPATVTVKGKDPRGKPITETLALSQGAGAVTTANFFSELDEDEPIAYPAADDVDATVAIGIGAKLGLSYAPKVRGGNTMLTNEFEDGAAPTAGTLTAVGAADLPYGSYTPNSALNGALDFIITYEYDPTT